MAHPTQQKQHSPMASNSSMKMIAGAFSLARAKASRTSLAPSPMNICTSCGPASFRKVDFVWAAQARAKSVFPVPGGPYSSTPFGGWIPENHKLPVIFMTKYRLLGFFFLHSPLRESFLVIFQITGDKSSVMKFIFKKNTYIFSLRIPISLFHT